MPIKRKYSKKNSKSILKRNSKKLRKSSTRRKYNSKNKIKIGGSTCKNKKKFKIEEGVLWFSPYVRDPKCTEIKIPKKVTEIGNEAFRDCSSLTSITIPDSVTAIGDKAFWECNSLASIAIPDSVAYIGESAFHKLSLIHI